MNKKKTNKVFLLIIVTIFIFLTSVIFIKNFNTKNIVTIAGPMMEPNFHSLEGYEYKKLEKERNNLRRGDVVVYKEKDNLKVRRVVGLPGEEIEIINSQVVIDDQNLSENYIQEDTTRRGNREKMSIPVGSYALMLDNRASSPADIVIVSVENIIGTITK